MKAPMSVGCRLKLAEVLAPELGNSARLLMYRKFIEGLSLSEEEQKQVDYYVEMGEDGRMMSHFMRKPENDPMKVIDTGEIITEIIIKKLKPLEESDILPPELLDLFLWVKPAIVEMKKNEETTEGK